MEQLIAQALAYSIAVWNAVSLRLTKHEENDELAEISHHEHRNQIMSSIITEMKQARALLLPNQDRGLCMFAAVHA